MSPALLAGLGQRDRGDDAAGLAVAGLVAAMRLPGVAVIGETTPHGLVDVWAGADLVVVADAARSGRPPGTVQVLHAGHRALPAWTGSGGTHAFGLAAAVELARTLGRLPPQLVIVGVEARQFGFGEPLSPPVAAAIPLAACTAARILTGPPEPGSPATQPLPPSQNPRTEPPAHPIGGFRGGSAPREKSRPHAKSPPGGGDEHAQPARGRGGI